MTAKSNTSEVAPIAIIGAMEQEVVILTEQLVDMQVHEVAGIKMFEGVLNGVPVVVSQSGIGKVNAAITTTLVIERFTPRAVINTGSAGGIAQVVDGAEPLKVGDIVIGSSVAHHDVDVTAFGYQIGQMAQMPTDYPCDPALITAIQSATTSVATDASIHHGKIVSGDQFIASTEAFSRIQQNFPQAMALEMEAAAIAQTCYRFTTPFVVVRAISDLANEEASISFDEFIVQAGKRSAQMVIAALAYVS